MSGKHIFILDPVESTITSAAAVSSRTGTSSCNTSYQHTSTKLAARRSVHNKLGLILLFNLLLLTPISCQVTNGTNVTQAESEQEQSVLKESTVYVAPKSLNFIDCYHRMDTGPQAAYICGGNQELLPLLLYAEQEGKEICEKTFQDELWNCTGFSILKEPKITKGEVYKESAYVYALSFAVIAHTVTQACALGELESCTCDEGPTHYEDDVKYKHCSDEYGLKVAERFLRLRDTKKGKDLKDELFDHNIEATKNVIRDSISDSDTQCKCHGVSGSCAVKTCYSQLTNINDIALKLKERYDASCEVKSNGHSQNTWIPKSDSCSSFSEKDFIFRTDYDWCVSNPVVDATGVVGRVCEPHSDGPNSCQNLCRRCDKTPIKLTQLVQVERNCQFHFCCEITCERLQREESYHVCV